MTLKEEMARLATVFKNEKIILLIIISSLLGVLYVALFKTALAEFFLAQLILLSLILLIGEIRSSYYAHEGTRLMSLEELREFYRKSAQASQKHVDTYIVHERYRILARYLGVDEYSPQSFVPGVVEKVFGPGLELFVKPVPPVGGWRRVMDEILKPHMERLDRIFQVKYGWNDLKTRLVDISGGADRIILYVEPVSFYRILFTTYSGDLDYGGRTYRQIVEPMLLTDNPGRPILDITSSASLPVANPLGLNTLIVYHDRLNDDYYILLQYRSNSTVAEWDKLIHPVSGLLEWKRLGLGGEEEIVRLALGEALEEGEVSPHGENVTRRIACPIALTRNLRFLGQPELTLMSYMESHSVCDIVRTTRLDSKSETKAIYLLRLERGEAERVAEKLEFCGSRDPGHRKVIYCGLLRLIAENLAIPIVEDGRVSSEILVVARNDVCKNEKLDLPKVKIVDMLTWDMFSASLLVGLKGVVEAYNTYCRTGNISRFR